MSRLPEPARALIAAFLCIIVAVPIVETLKEMRGDDGVIAFEVFGDWPTSQSLRSYEKKLEDANWAAQLSRRWLQFAQFALLKEGGEKVVVGSDGWYFFKPGLKYMLSRHEAAQASGASDDPVGAIVDFRNQLAVRGFKLLVLPVPNKESIYPDRLTPRAKNLRGVMAPRTREVLEKLRSAGVEVVDLFKEFGESRRQNAPGPEVPLYLAQDTHWSPAGVALAARSVARRLVELGWVQPGQTNYQEKAAPVQRRGDILRMLQTPRIEQFINPESVAGVQVVQGEGGGKPYKDEAAAEILILGDSFMRIYQTDTPTSAGFIAHLAKELKQPMMSIVNDGGGSTLVREELCSRALFLQNKKVVLWEFVERDIGIGVKGWRRTPLPAAAPRVGVN